MEKASDKNFISILTMDKPVMIFFTTEDKEAENKKIRKIIQEIEKDLTLLPSFEYKINETENSLILAEHLGATDTPILMFFKGGNFSRYKDKLFTKKSILKFIGNAKIYQPKEIKQTEETVVKESPGFKM